MSAIALGLIARVDTYEELSDTTLHAYLDMEASESRTSVTLFCRDSLVKR